MEYQTAGRLVFTVLILTLSVSFSVSYISVSSADSANAVLSQRDVPYERRDPVVAPRPNITVVTSQTGYLVAMAPDGRLLYHNDTYDRYYDVDPLSDRRMSVVYAATETLNKSQCGGDTRCFRNVIEIVNLSTDETSRIYSRIVPEREAHGLHDVDRISATEYIVADIAFDRVFIVNVTTGVIEWAWEAQRHFPLSGGGPYPEDWTHLNDVEVLPDGRIMVSLRNQDQVVFIDRDTGLVRNMTLGREDDYTVLFEQHNPDYIPVSDGGPAVLVADSQNNRLVEYHRQDGEWRQTWEWRDSDLRWPRDADRLPNGHTLVADSNGNRVLELDRDGSVVWSMSVPLAYDAERLGTGDESQDGPSAVAIDLPSKVETDRSGRIKQIVKTNLSPKIVNALRFVFPAWASLTEVFLLAAILFTSVIWGILEFRWQPIEVTAQWPVSKVRSPLRFDRNE